MYAIFSKAMARAALPCAKRSWFCGAVSIVSLCVLARAACAHRPVLCSWVFCLQGTGSWPRNTAKPLLGRVFGRLRRTCLPRQSHRRLGSRGSARRSSQCSVGDAQAGTCDVTRSTESTLLSQGWPDCLFVFTAQKVNLGWSGMYECGAQPARVSWKNGGALPPQSLRRVRGHAREQGRIRMDTACCRDRAALSAPTPRKGWARTPFSDARLLGGSPRPRK